MKATEIARWERRLRPLLTQLPPALAVKMYSKGRSSFLKELVKDIPNHEFVPPSEFRRTLWGIDFRSPLMNAAGMFKNGECCLMTSKQGAGAYLGGTTTFNARPGNYVAGYIPFIAYPCSHGASNKLGLPNKGYKTTVQQLHDFERIKGYPLGWSLMGSPDFDGKVKLDQLVFGMELYEKAEVDFIEINGSCPNTPEGRPSYHEIVEIVKHVYESFLKKRKRRFPVILKLSNDTELSQIPFIMDLLFSHGFDGVNFGNTSTNYESIRQHIHPRERKLFDYFSSKFGGGYSGRYLKEKSLALCSTAVEYRNKGGPSQEFHVIRTGGIETFADLIASENAGISLNQWFTGYFEGFAQHGHKVYAEFFRTMRS